MEEQRFIVVKIFVGYRGNGGLPEKNERLQVKTRTTQFGRSYYPIRRFYEIQINSDR
jgi:hypothetical protein